MAFRLYDSNNHVIGNMTDVVTASDGEMWITLDTGHKFRFHSNNIRWDNARNAYIKKDSGYHQDALDNARYITQARAMYNAVYQKEVRAAMNAATIKNAIFAPPATIVYWSDGSKTIVKCSEKDVFDPEKGLAMAIAKRCGGNNGSYYKEIRHWVEKSRKKYPGKPYTESSSVENDSLKKYIAQAKNSYEAALEAAAKGNPANFLSMMGRVSAALSILELEINK